MTAPEQMRADVTPEDRALFIALFKLPERHHERVHQGERDDDAEMQAIVRHRTEVLHVLKDPNAVHVNMLRGSIARPSIQQIIHIYGEDAMSEALTRPATAELVEALKSCIESLEYAAGEIAGTPGQKGTWAAWSHPNQSLVQARAALARPATAELVEVEKAILNLETRDVHVGYDNGPGGGNYVYEDYVSLAEVKGVIRAALARHGGGE